MVVFNITCSRIFFFGDEIYNTELRVLNMASDVKLEKNYRIISPTVCKRFQDVFFIRYLRGTKLTICRCQRILLFFANDFSNKYPMSMTLSASAANQLNAYCNTCLLINTTVNHNWFSVHVALHPKQSWQLQSKSKGLTTKC